MRSTTMEAIQKINSSLMSIPNYSAPGESEIDAAPAPMNFRNQDDSSNPSPVNPDFKVEETKVFLANSGEEELVEDIQSPTHTETDAKTLKLEIETDMEFISGDLDDYSPPPFPIPIQDHAEAVSEEVDRAVIMYENLFKEFVDSSYGGINHKEFNSFVQTLGFNEGKGYLKHENENFVFVNAGLMRVLNSKVWYKRPETITELTIIKDAVISADVIFIPISFDYARSLKTGKEKPFTGKSSINSLRYLQPHAAMMIINMSEKELVYVDKRLEKRKYVDENKGGKFVRQSLWPVIQNKWEMKEFKWRTHKIK